MIALISSANSGAATCPHGNTKSTSPHSAKATTTAMISSDSKETRTAADVTRASIQRANG